MHAFIYQPKGNLESHYKDLTCSTSPLHDVQGKNNNRVNVINLFYLKNSFDVLNEQDSILERVTDLTCALDSNISLGDYSTSTGSSSPSSKKDIDH